jgi:hypothetical protein
MRDIMGFELRDVVLKKGQQIVYLPDHIDLKNINQNWFYPNGAQPGFVTSGPSDRVGQEEAYFCRYWQYDYKRGIYVPELRTTANSELTPSRCLILLDTFVPQHIEYWIKTLSL